MKKQPLRIASRTGYTQNMDTVADYVVEYSEAAVRTAGRYVLTAGPEPLSATVDHTSDAVRLTRELYDE